MEISTATTIMQEAIWTGLLVSTPILIFTLIAGLIISILQAVTQIHEMTLTFIPKILAAVVAIFIFGNWMLMTILNFTSKLFINFSAMLR